MENRLIQVYEKRLDNLGYVNLYVVEGWDKIWLNKV